MSHAARIIGENDGGHHEVVSAELEDIMGGLYRVLKEHPERQIGVLLFPAGTSVEMCERYSERFGEYLAAGKLPPAP